MIDPHNPRPRPQPIQLRELFGDTLLPEVTVTGITMDSRAVQPGDIFVAPAGATAHGAQFAAAAVAAGAVAVVTDIQGQQLLAAAALPSDIPVIIIEDVRANVGLLASAVYGDPSDSMIVVGVTGTNGKTTMSYLVESVFAAAGHTTGIMGTTGHRSAGVPIPTKHTTPEAPVVHALLALMAQDAVSAVVMEVSSHALSYGRVGGVNFDVAVFTNLTQDHLDFHGSMDEYYQAKARLFDLASSKVICVDDEWGQQLAAAHPDAVTYSVTGVAGAHWRARDWRAEGAGTVAEVVTPDGTTETLRVPLPGSFNVANALGALAVADVIGIARDVAVQGVAQCAGVPGRMQKVPNSQGIHAFVDYAHTPDAVARAIQAAPSPAIVVLGCGGDRDAAKRPLMGAAAARLSRLLVVTDDNPRSEDPAAIRAAMLEGVETVAKPDRAEVVEVGDRAEAIRYAVQRALAGDSILVLGKGHEQGQYVGAKVLPFDDASQLAAALAEVNE